MSFGIATWLATKLWGRWLLKIAEWIGAGVKWLFKDRRHILIAILGLFAAYQWLEAGKYSRAHERAVVALERANKTIADMKAASEANRAAQIAMNKAVTDKQTQIERLNREKANLNAIAIRDASTRYADNNRLSKVCPAYSSGTNTAAQGDLAKGNDRLQANSIILGQSDFDVLNARAADAVRYEEWARSLIAADLAVEAD